MNLEKFNANEEFKDFSLPHQTTYMQSMRNNQYYNNQGLSTNQNFNFVKREERFENIPTAKLRLVPKSDSVRPIMTFYKKFREPKTGKLIKVGNYLQWAKIILRSFKRVLGIDVGYAVFDNYQIFQRYADFKAKWKKEGCPKLDYCTMDIKKCYDSVDLGTLFELLREEDVFKEFYMITRFHKIIRNRRFCFRTKENNDQVPLSSLFIMKTKDTALPFTEIDDMSKYTQDDIIKDGKTIYIDIPYKTIITKEEILESINVVCRKVVVKLGKETFKLKKGLPQGLSISSVLSSFYYSILEHKATRYLERDRFSIHNSLSMVMRLTDDYLVLTNKPENAKNFLTQMMQLADNNAFQFNKHKLTTSFDFKYDETDIEARDPDVCKWIGKIIYPKNLELEHTQILDEKTAFFTVSTNMSQFDKYPAQIIKAKMKSFILNHNLFYLDPKINSIEKIFTILTNIINSAYLKIKSFIDRCLADPEGTGTNKNKKGKAKDKKSKNKTHNKAKAATPKLDFKSHEVWIARKFYEALIDCAFAVFTIIEEAKQLNMETKRELIRKLYNHFVETFLKN